MSFRIARFLIRMLYRMTARIQIVGAEHIPAEGGMVAVTNHVGRLDTGLPFCLIDRDDIILLMAEKYRRTVFGRALTAAIKGIWVDRYNADLAAVRACLRRLERGGVLVIAPEGTRSRTGKLLRARSGASFLASKAALPIVPVGVLGTEDTVVKARLRRLRRAQVVVTFGEPFRLTVHPGSRSRASLEAFDDELMCRIAALLPADRRGAYAEHPRLLELLTQNGAGPG